MLKLLIGGIGILAASVASTVMPTVILEENGVLSTKSGTLKSGSLAYDHTLEMLDRQMLTEHGDILFAQADLDADGALSADEFAVLHIVQAELATLNGFIPVHQGTHSYTLTLATHQDGEPLSQKVTRLEATARRAFYAVAGEDRHMDAMEFQLTFERSFTKHDRNSDGQLSRRELHAFAADQAGQVLSSS